MNFNNLLISIPTILYALTIHEYFHGWTANKFGDPTARLQGRLTLNPLAHIDILGALCFVFANFVSALLFGVIFQLLRKAPFIPMNVSTILYNLLILGIMMNLSLAFFNMIPLFPLDGSHILEGLLPYPMAQKYKEIERYSPFILLGLVIMGNYGNISILSMILGPPIQYFLRLFTGL